MTTTWLLWFLSCFGASYVLAAAHITLPLRTWVADQKGRVALWFLLLIECVACTSYHFGWLAVLFGLVPGPRTVLQGALVAFASAASSLLLARVAGLTKDDA